MSQLLSAAKFGVLAAIAFFGPKLITESGNYLGRMEHLDESSSPSSETGLIHPSDLAPDAKNAPFDFERNDLKSPNESVRYWPSSESRSDVTLTPTTTFAPTAPTAVSSAAPTITPLETALRFDRTPAWIVATWPRVRTDDTAPPWRGYRVPLLTGTNPDDLSGALTYYFDQRRTRRISFVGRTGDYQKLLAYLEYRFGMTPDDDSTPAETRYHSTLEPDRHSNAETSRLTIRGAAVFDAATPTRRFDVTFDLYAP